MKFSRKTENNIVYETVPKLLEAGFYNLFTTKYFGHSFEDQELNFGTNCQDSEDAILQNYADVLSLMHLTPQKAVRSKQTHSDISLCVDQSFGGEGITKEHRFLEADGLITQEEDLAVCIFFADCVPVLIADPKNKWMAAVHSGWKGTKKNIVGKTLEQMIRDHGCRPADLLCAIGPSIGICHFEVSEELYRDMTSRYGADIGEKRDGAYYLDLKKTVQKQMLSCGVANENIAVSNLCTVCHKDLYSFRREGEKAGRMAAFIARKK